VIDAWIQMPIAGKVATDCRVETDVVFGEDANRGER
jgi:hypothetical protein